MLAPILIALLIGCSLMLLAGWAGETLRASAWRGREPRYNTRRRTPPTTTSPT